MNSRYAHKIIRINRPQNCKCSVSKPNCNLTNACWPARNGLNHTKMNSPEMQKSQSLLIGIFNPVFFKKVFIVKELSFQSLNIQKALISKSLDSM